MCLCGMVGAEIADVPDTVASGVRAFFAANRVWLERVLTRQGAPKPFEQAAMLIAALEGAMLVARVSGDSQLFDVIADCVSRRSAGT